MKTTTNDVLFQKAQPEDGRPVLSQPEKCGPKCVQYAYCRFPKSCPVLVKQRRREKEAMQKYGKFEKRDPVSEL